MKTTGFPGWERPMAHRRRRLRCQDHLCHGSLSPLAGSVRIVRWHSSRFLPCMKLSSACSEVVRAGHHPKACRPINYEVEKRLSGA